MTVATFLLLIQILDGLGGASVAILTIQKDLEDRGFHADDLLPEKHLAAVKATVLAGLHSSAAADFIDGTLGR